MEASVVVVLEQAVLVAAAAADVLVALVVPQPVVKPLVAEQPLPLVVVPLQAVVQPPREVQVDKARVAELVALVEPPLQPLVVEKPKPNRVVAEADVAQVGSAELPFFRALTWWC